MVDQPIFQPRLLSIPKKRLLLPFQKRVELEKNLFGLMKWSFIENRHEAIKVPTLADLVFNLNKSILKAMNKRSWLAKKVTRKRVKKVIFYYTNSQYDTPGVTVERRNILVRLIPNLGTEGKRGTVIIFKKEDDGFTQMGGAFPYELQEAVPFNEEIHFEDDCVYVECTHDEPDVKMDSLDLPILGEIFYKIRNHINKDGRRIFIQRLIEKNGSFEGPIQSIQWILNKDEVTNLEQNMRIIKNLQDNTGQDLLKNTLCRLNFVYQRQPDPELYDLLYAYMTKV